MACYQNSSIVLKDFTKNQVTQILFVIATISCSILLISYCAISKSIHPHKIDGPEIDLHILSQFVIPSVSGECWDVIDCLIVMLDTRIQAALHNTIVLYLEMYPTILYLYTLLFRVNSHSHQRNHAMQFFFFSSAKTTLNPHHHHSYTTFTFLLTLKYERFGPYLPEFRAKQMQLTIHIARKHH